MSTFQCMIVMPHSIFWPRLPLHRMENACYCTEGTTWPIDWEGREEPWNVLGGERTKVPPDISPPEYLFNVHRANGKRFINNLSSHTVYSAECTRNCAEELNEELPKKSNHSWTVLTSPLDKNFRSGCQIKLSRILCTEIAI